MPKLDLNINEYPEGQTLPADEYELEVIRAEVKTSESGGKRDGQRYINLRLVSPDHPEAEDVYYMLWLPSDFSDERAARRAADDFRNFFRATGQEVPDQIDTDELVGLRVWALLKEQETDRGVRNEVRRFVQPS